MKYGAFLNNPQTKCQSSEWKPKTSPKKEKFCWDKNWEKAMLEVLIHYKDVSHDKFITGSQTVNKKLSLEIFK